MSQMPRTETHNFQALCHPGVLVLSSQGCPGNAGAFSYTAQPRSKHRELLQGIACFNLELSFRVKPLNPHVRNI